MTLPLGSPKSKPVPGSGYGPRQLWPADVSRLRLEGHPRVDAADAAALLTLLPGASYWLPQTHEFILVVPWRHRTELITVHAFGAYANEFDLVESVAAQAEADGRAGLVLTDIHETRPAGFYARHRFDKLEEIVTYCHRNPARLARMETRSDLDFVRLNSPNSPLRREVIALDHAAFPWFWWNSPDEFTAYIRIPAVEVWAGLLDGEVVSYAGITNYRRWGHLDRIATLPSLQGQRIAQATMAFAARRMVEQGGRQIVLSTQGANERSRTLYDQSGFQHTPSDDYLVYVREIDSARVHGKPADESSIRNRS